ncbi:MAG: PAS domain S-box protein, partial [Acidiferrobacterales bacterium]|nr:PAS domain S-box protein [Acidiferrobacterales bacterium]
VRFAFICELCEDNPERVRTLAWWTGTECGENFEYALRATPCGEVFVRDGAYYPRKVQQRFPEDEWLTRHGVESYLAVPLEDRDNTPIGHLGLMHDGPMINDLPREKILRILASRAAAELERTRAEKALRESEKRFRDYFKFQSIGIATTSLDKRWIEVNDQLCRILGYSRQELLEKSWVDLTFPDDRAANLALFDRATKGELDGYSLDKRFIRKDGSVIDINLSVRCVRSDTSQLRYFLAVYQDISERKQAERALRASEERFRNLVEGSIAGILIHRDWKPLFVNQAYARLHGYESVDEILALDSISSLIAPHERVRLQGYRDTRPDGRPAPVEYEYQAVRKDRAIVVLRNLVRMVNWQGMPALQHTVVDVTERHETEAALRASEARFRSLFEQSNDAVIIHTIDGKILDANSRACEMLGYAGRDLMSMRIPSLHPQGEQGRVAEALQLVSERESIRFESQFRRADGTEIDVEISARIIDPEERTVQGIVRDITERKRAEETMRRHEQMVSTSTDLMAFLDKTYTYRTVNSAYAKAIGKQKSEIVGHHVAEVVGKETFESRLKPHLDRCLLGEHINYQDWIHLPGQGRRFLDAHYDPFFDGNGAVSGVVADIRDITESKQVEGRLRQHEDQLRTLASEMSLAEERERRRIAADLHDGAVQNLALSRIKTGALGKLISSEEGAVLLRDIQTLIDQTIRDTRSLVFELSPPVLYELGFEPALEWLAEQAETRYAFVCDVQTDKLPKPLDKNIEVVLFQAVRELLANVGKHAGATEASIQLSNQG